MSDAAANKAFACRFMEAFSKGDIDLWASMLAEGATYEIMGSSVMSGRRSKSEIVATTRALVELFPQGIHLEVTGLTAEGDRVAMEACGTAKSVSGVPYNNSYHLLFIIRDGKVLEAREYLDTKLVDKVAGSKVV